MSETLSKLRNEAKETDLDGYVFVPHDDSDGSSVIEGFKYKECGDPMGGSEMGAEYEIVLFTEDGVVTDRFSAILVSPVEYVIRMTEDGFYGIVGRLTTKSSEAFSGFMEELGLTTETQTDEK